MEKLRDKEEGNEFVKLIRSILMSLTQNIWLTVILTLGEILKIRNENYWGEMLTPIFLAAIS